MHDIVDRPAPAEGLIGPQRVERERSDEFAVLGDYADVGAGDQEPDLAVLVNHTDGDVTESAEVAKRELSEAVHLVATDAVVEGSDRGCRPGLEHGVENGGGSAAVEGAVWAAAVVVAAEGIEGELELGKRCGGWLLGQETLEGLVESFDAPMFVKLP